jgi:predicted MFS family arabinose efflux permease
VTVVAETSAADTTEKPPGPYAWYVAVILMSAYALSFIDRKLPFILVESIKRDLHVSDTQIGLLTGVMFALVYSTVAIPIASFADRHSRKRLIAVSVLLWSGVTTLGGLSTNFWQLAASRVGVAAGEAACTPAAHSMIADYFKPKFRSRAMGLYFVGAQLGIVLGLALGGWINELANWRVAMFLLGAPGLVLTLLMLFTVKEPKRAPSPVAEAAATLRPVKFGEAMRALFRHSTFTHLMIAALLSSFTSGAVQAFTPAYIIRTFHFTSAQTGLSYGLIMGGAGAIGALLGGSVGDRLRVSHPRRALIFVAVAMALGAPCMAVAFMSGSYWVFLALIFVAQVGSMTYAGPSFAIIQGLVEPRMHAVASAVYLFALSGIGLSLGPLAVGAISDFLKAHGSSNSLRWALLVVIVPRLWSGVHYLIAALRLDVPAAAVPTVSGLEASAA